MAAILDENPPVARETASRIKRPLVLPLVALHHPSESLISDEQRQGEDGRIAQDMDDDGDRRVPLYLVQATANTTPPTVRVPTA
jgi:hypothetical protein